MKATCQNCNQKFDAKRRTARFCSAKCRVEAARKAGVDPETGEVLEVLDSKTDKLVKVPIKKVKETGYDREKNLEAFQKMGLAKVDWITTGINDFDSLTQIPRGRITQIQGPYGVGKTTLCLNMIKGLKGQQVLYIDTEASLNPELLVDLEIEAENFMLYNDSAYFEDIAEVIRAAAKSGDFDIVILDSLAACTTRAEAENDITASNIGQKAKLTHKLIHLTQMDFKRTNTAFVVINQEREVIGSYVPQKYTPGGNAVPYAASLIVALKTVKSWRFPKSPKDGLYLGHEVEATIIKSKVNQPWRTQKFKLYYPKPVAQPQEGSDVQPAF